uniref:Putative phenylalanine-tRNA ligase n=1 Tax=viral metagenome TaxID=1070528 RepID=A0A6H2A611_9ZZZZ
MSTTLYERHNPYFALTRFWGGESKGMCIQITIESSYVTLDNKEIKEVIKTITEALKLEDK